MLILILSHVQYLQNYVSYFGKGLSDQMHSSPDAHHLINKSSSSKIYHSSSTTRDFLPPLLNAIWKILISDVSRVFLAYVNYTTGGYMLNADGHLMD